MTNPVLHQTVTTEDLDVAWIAWEDGEAVAVWPRWLAESWLRKGNYMHKSISPWTDQSLQGRAAIIRALDLLIV